MSILTPSTAARLHFWVTDPTTGIGETGLAFGDITTAGYATEANGVRSSVTTVTLTSDAAITGALATGQLIEIGLGEYAIDVPAVGTSGLIYAVVTVTGFDVRPVVYWIDVAVSTRNAVAPATPDNVTDAQTAILATLPTSGRAATQASVDVIDGIVDAILEDTDTTLPAQIAGISGGSGTGARTVTVTVDDGTTALQNARVRMTEGANTYTALTNVSGVAVFNLDDATYAVGITKSGYTYTGTTLVVDGTETVTYSMTQVTPSAPDDPALCAVTIPIVDQYGVALPDEPVTVTFTGYAAGATDKPLVVSPPPPQISNDDGFVLVNLVRFGAYRVDYGDRLYQRSLTLTVPDQGTYTVQES